MVEEERALAGSGSAHEGRLRLSRGGKLAAAGLTLVLAIALGAFAWRWGLRLEDLAALGYPGVFLVMLVSGAGTFFPAPWQAAIFVAGAAWNPVLVGLAAGLGNATGELVGYAAGAAGNLLLGRGVPPSWLGTFRTWLGRYGFFAILAIAAIPNPIFDAVGLIAGSALYPVRRFWVACALGNCAKYVVYAHLGGTIRSVLGI